MLVFHWFATFILNFASVGMALHTVLYNRSLLKIISIVRCSYWSITNLSRDDFIGWLKHIWLAIRAASENGVTFLVAGAPRVLEDGVASARAPTLSECFLISLCIALVCFWIIAFWHPGVESSPDNFSHRKGHGDVCHACPIQEVQQLLIKETKKKKKKTVKDVSAAAAER